MNEKKKSRFWIVAGYLTAAAFLLMTASVLFFDRDTAVSDQLFAGEIRTAAKKNGLDADFVRAVIFRESRFDPFKKGSNGEYGLMQVLPAGSVRDWAKFHGVAEPVGGELFDVRTNLEVGCWYLGQGVKKYRAYRHGLELALIRYNAGPSRAEAWKPETFDGEVIPRIQIASTKKYVQKVMAYYRHYLTEREKAEK